MDKQDFKIKGLPNYNQDNKIRKNNDANIIYIIKHKF